MKQSWKRIGVILLIVIMGLNLYGCFTPKRTASQIEAALEAKYGEEFRVINMGGRNGGNMDVITAHCCPVVNEDIVFQARLDSSGNLVSDGYVQSFAINEVEEYIKGVFEKHGLTVQINFMCSGAEMSEISKLDPSDEYFLETAVGYDVRWGGIIAVQDIGNLDDMAEYLYEVMEEIWKQYPQIQEWNRVFIISVEDYDTCVEEMRKYDFVHTSLFRDYEIQGSVAMSINKVEEGDVIEGISKTEEEILQELQEEYDEYFR